MSFFLCWFVDDVKLDYFWFGIGLDLFEAFERSSAKIDKKEDKRQIWCFLLRGVNKMKWENWMLCFCFKLSGNSCWADKLTLLSFSKKATASIFKHYFFLFQISFLQIVGNKKSKPKARRSSKVSRHSLNCSFPPLSQCLSIKEQGKSCLFRMEGFSVSWIPSTLSSLSLSTSSTLFSFPFFFSLLCFCFKGGFSSCILHCLIKVPWWLAWYSPRVTNKQTKRGKSQTTAQEMTWSCVIVPWKETPNKESSLKTDNSRQPPNISSKRE